MIKIQSLPGAQSDAEKVLPCCPWCSSAQVMEPACLLIVMSIACDDAFFICVNALLVLPEAVLRAGVGEEK